MGPHLVQTKGARLPNAGCRRFMVSGDISMERQSPKFQGLSLSRTPQRSATRTQTHYRIVADNPRIVTGLDDVGLAWTDLLLAPVVVNDVHRPRRQQSEIVRLAPLASDDRASVPTRLAREARAGSARDGGRDRCCQEREVAAKLGLPYGFHAGSVEAGGCLRPHRPEKMAICRLSTGATGLEPATSGVTGRSWRWPD